MRANITLILILVIYSSLPGCSTKHSSGLAPGYDNSELSQLLPAMERTYDSADIGGFKTPEPMGIKQVFRSKVSPLKNRFDVWLTDDKKAVITIRGTIVDTGALSFTAAFYGLMAPACGKIKMSDTSWFAYKLAELPGAGVHLGMLLGLYFISGELLEQINMNYLDGIRDFIIVGHSQGSGIGLLAMPYLLYLQKDGKLPADIRFKSYCIATPKTGNLQFVYDFEYLTAGGWALSVNNVIDWVPEIAITLQSGGDFPKVSPFHDMKEFLHGVNYSTGPYFEAGFEKFSGAVPAIIEQLNQVIHESVYPKVMRVMPGYMEPECMKSCNYERAGINVPLFPDKDYYKLFPNDPAKFQVWENHSVYPYYILVKANRPSQIAHP